VVSLMEQVFDQCTRGRVNVLRLPEERLLEVDAETGAEFDAMLDRTPEGDWLDYGAGQIGS
jgi:hypothetical protein